MTQIFIKTFILLFFVGFYSFQADASIQDYLNEVKETLHYYKYKAVKKKNPKGTHLCEQVKSKLKSIDILKEGLSKNEKTKKIVSQHEKRLYANVVVHACKQNEFEKLSVKQKRRLKNFARYSPINCKFEPSQVNHKRRLAIYAGGVFYIYGNEIKEAVHLFCSDQVKKQSETIKDGPEPDWKTIDETKKVRKVGPIVEEPLGASQ